MRYSFLALLTRVVSLLVVLSVSFGGVAVAQTTYTVTTTADGGPGSLRQAILSANDGSGLPADVIEFAIPNAGPHTIVLSSDLPAVTDPVSVLGTTQSGYAGSPLVEVDGNGTAATGLRVRSGAVEVRALSLVGFSGTGILIDDGDGGVTVAGCYVGVRPDGTTAAGNNVGIEVERVTQITIGGPGSTDGNVISGNAGRGLSVVSFNALFGSDVIAGLQVEGNRIGTTADGTAGLGNGDTGVFLSGRYDDAQIVGNLVSGNDGDGIHLSTADGPSDPVVTVRGNRVGTNAAGTAAIENTDDGLFVDETPRVLVGGPTAAARNLISGNGERGITVSGHRADDVRIQGNYVGVNAAGDAALPNRTYGIDVVGDTDGRLENVLIGGPNDGEGNLVSGNGPFSTGFDGIHLRGSFTLLNGSFQYTVRTATVEGNVVGTDATGTAAVGNQRHGMNISNVENVSIINNLISGNEDEGLRLTNVDGSAVVEQNRTGVDASSTAALPNGTDGMQLGSLRSGATLAVRDNVVSGNGRTGIFLIPSEDNAGVTVERNLVGVSGDGQNAPLGNDGEGVRIAGADRTFQYVVGSTSPADGNVIAYNGSSGVSIPEYQPATSSVPVGGDDLAVRGNLIYGNGGIAIDLGTGGFNGEPGSSPGETANDAGDPDEGVNRFQNTPEVTEATYDAGTGSLSLRYLVDTAPASATYPIRVEVYRADTSDQAVAFLGAESIPEPDAQAERTFTFQPAASFDAADWVVATATDAAGNTSELNRIRQSFAFQADPAKAGRDTLSHVYPYPEVWLDSVRVGFPEGQTNVPTVTADVQRYNGDPRSLSIPTGKQRAIAGYWTVSLDLNAEADSVEFDACFDLENLAFPRENVTLSALRVFRRPTLDQPAPSDPWVAQPVGFREDTGGTVTHVCAADQKTLLNAVVGEFIVAADPADLPVEWAGFDGVRDGRRVHLTWTTLSERQNAGFEVQRAAGGEAFRTVAFVDGRGTTDRPHTYRHADPLGASASRDVLTYRLRQVDVDGTPSYSTTITVQPPRPVFTVHAPRPNPASGYVVLDLDLPGAEPVQVEVYNVLGQRVAAFEHGAGTGTAPRVTLDTRRWSPGLYFVRVTAGEHAGTQRLTVVR